MTTDNDTPIVVRIINSTTKAYIHRLITTGIYGNRGTEVALKLIHDQLDALLDSGKLIQREADGKHAREIDRFLEQEQNDKEKINKAETD